LGGLGVSPKGFGGFPQGFPPGDEDSDKSVNKEVKGDIKDKDIINGWYFNRMSIVMYLREKMIKCKDKTLWKNKAGGGYSIENDVINYLPDDYINYMRYKYNMFN
jgi:hypothetical protein